MASTDINGEPILIITRADAINAYNCMRDGWAMTPEEVETAKNFLRFIEETKDAE